ncbi:MAG: hypothetical protein HZA34_04850 [Candidatus Pacebacteria bacterium]|nr:hypothetical protein [Candidatus Paceibacterota bacterium]
MKKTTVHEQTYLYVSWESTGKYMMDLAESIIRHDKTYDRIIALAKGGLTWSRMLSDYIAVEQLSSIQISFYDDIAKTKRSPVIIQSLPISIQGENVLIFDDIADSGETLTLATTYAKQHGAKDIATATLAVKQWTKTLPDFYAFTSSEWIIWPYEVRETMGLLKKMWTERGDRESSIKKQLHQIGISQEEIALFYNLV